jgi:serine/threonine-protein kinase RsbW
MTVTHVAPDERRFAWELTARPQDIRRWRDEVEAAVRKLGAGDGGAEWARLGVSELLSNVCKHVSDRRCRLEVCLGFNEALQVRLFDRSRTAPSVLRPDGDAEAGRGLLLLRELSAGVGYTLTGEGKWVWAEAPKGGAPDAC